MQNRSKDEMLERAINFDISEVTHRFAKNENIDFAAAVEIERELKKFLVLGVLTPGQKYPMTSTVDPLWHEFLVFTRLYKEFCEHVCGDFIHHEPRRHRDEDVALTKLRFDKFFSDYESTFLEQAPKHIWPRFSDLHNGSDNCSTCHHHDCSRCNTCD